MGQEWNQTSLGRAAGVAANTVGNALNPDRRQSATKSGKLPSIKLTELDQIAKALKITVADLVTDRTESQRLLVLRERAAAYYLEHGTLPTWAQGLSGSNMDLGKRTGEG